ncbi:type II toxin-antitoxin system Phd/YefM family antitoxin [Peterkaempfera griseoplana]|uniref:type II toxin-antitoxin system Phd/YefM family antitoxin n=1 Tax=Peterkaempfera griseoplana TaxID=66896 RepID=UPI0006E1ED48|nr:type II toxin-antitoxin system Phd/YefM family antitoxin [Peterkaempfera griseoplana]
MPAEIPVTQARAAIADLVNRVAYAGERIALTRHGRTVAALVSAEDLERLRALDADPAAAARAVSELSTRAPALPARPFGIAARDPQRPATRQDL